MVKRKKRTAKTWITTRKIRGKSRKVRVTRKSRGRYSIKLIGIKRRAKSRRGRVVGGDRKGIQRGHAWHMERRKTYVKTQKSEKYGKRKKTVRRKKVGRPRKRKR